MQYRVRMIATAGLLAVSFAIAGQAYGQARDRVQGKGKAALIPQFGDLSQVPPDSLEAERVRVWIPQEQKGKCRMTVNILDGSGQVIRHLVNQMLPPNYYNFYWDKKDDSGRYVESGIYRYDVGDCGENKDGEVEAKFKKWELLSRIMPFDTARAGRVDIDLLADSALVSIVINYRTGRLADAPMTDSLFMAGHHRFNWTPDPKIRPGRYHMTVTVGDYERSYKFSYKKKKN